MFETVKHLRDKSSPAASMSVETMKTEEVKINDCIWNVNISIHLVSIKKKKEKELD